MSEYRDDADAARHRARVLEEELAMRDEESVAQKAQLERQRVQLAAKDAEIEELRAHRAHDAPRGAATLRISKAKSAVFATLLTVLAFALVSAIVAVLAR